MKNKATSSADLSDTDNDKKHLQPEKALLDLPDVEDIPDQENIQPPKFREMADITASSADEEGEESFGDEFGETGDESESEVRKASLDRADGDGDPLNEAGLGEDRFGEDLDLPESEGTDEEDSAD